MKTRLRAAIRRSFDRFSEAFPRLSKLLGVARKRKRPILAVFRLAMHFVGFVLSISAVMDTRTPQGAIAWALCLNTCPYAAVPAYLVFGDSGMEGYFDERSIYLLETRPLADQLVSDIDEVGLAPFETSSLMETLSELSSLPITRGNQVELLVDGENTFKSIFDAIREAEDYIIVQFYIIRADEVGNELKDLLLSKANDGVKVFVLYDDYGCLDLPDDFAKDLQQAGAEVHSFMNLGGDVNRFQLNFRNHRKLVIVDGEHGFVGGHNVGDEYLGKHPTLTPWRDSHLRVTGPAVTCLQVSFAEDWKWATKKLPQGLDWDIRRWESNPAGQMQTICVPSGPADSLETCSLFFQSAIHSAQERVWIASPYFVPDMSVINALQLASLRGVDVKIIIPEIADQKLPYLSSFSYIEALEKAGATIYRYQKGFLHQKVLLIDDHFSAIGSANLDNRSFRLNFEVVVGVEDKDFAAKVSEMLVEDLSHSKASTFADFKKRGAFFRFKVRAARLLAPIQ